MPMGTHSIGRERTKQETDEREVQETSNDKRYLEIENKLTHA